MADIEKQIDRKIDIQRYSESEREREMVCVSVGIECQEETMGADVRREDAK